MKRARLAMIAAMIGLPACSFVIGTGTYTLVDGGDDATLFEAGDDSGNDVNDSGGLDVPDVPVCIVTGCLVEAGVCGSSCGVTSTTCQQACKGNVNCKNGCIATENACRSSCNANCNECTFAGGCQDLPGCADAAAM